MLEIYSVLSEYFNFEEIGRLYIDVEKDSWKYEQLKYKDRIDKHPSCVFLGNTNEDVKNWVLDRAPEFYYAGIEEVLERAQLKEYDAYGLFKYNEGKFIGDWFICPMIQGKKVHTITDERGKDWYKKPDLGAGPIRIIQAEWWNS